MCKAVEDLLKEREAKGMATGIEQGIEIGVEKSIKSIVEHMVASGETYTKETIAAITGIPIETVQRILPNNA